MERYPRVVVNVGTKVFHVDLTDMKYILTFSDKSFHPFLNFVMISMPSCLVPRYSITNLKYRFMNLSFFATDVLPSILF